MFPLSNTDPVPQLHPDTGASAGTVVEPRLALPNCPLSPSPQQDPVVPVDVQLNRSPAVTTARPVAPVTATAVAAWLVFVPLPSWPEPPAPQQDAAPLAIAHECVDPAAIADTLVSPLTGTGEGALPTATTPLPSLPSVVSPQQKASWSASAQVCESPDEMAMTERPTRAPVAVTATGLVWSPAVVPLPSRPSLARPQQDAKPSATAQVCEVPAEIAVM